jgi:lipoic acid synthetase
MRFKNAARKAEMKGIEKPKTRLPKWLKVKMPSGDSYHRLKKLVKTQGLHTVCESASCPNIGECWGNGTLTFMILGNTCTRTCKFCDVKTGKPQTTDYDEPRRIGESIRGLNLRHAVITSVDRDDLEDGGASIWAETIRVCHEVAPGMTVECLLPDFQGDEAAMDVVLEAKPDIFAHNIETVPRLYPSVRPQADYQQSLDVLRYAKSKGATTKCSVMVGLGEENEEVEQVMRDLVEVGCDIFTVGQYLRPSLLHHEVIRFWEPTEFEDLERKGREMGLGTVVAGPLVRSSYHADEAAREHGVARSLEV